MSTIQFACPFCGAVAEIDAEYAGHDIMCPACQNVLQLPPDAPSDTEPTPPEAADVPSVALDNAIPPAEASRPARGGKLKLWQSRPRHEPAEEDDAESVPELPQPLAPESLPPVAAEPIAEPIEVGSGGPINPLEDIMTARAPGGSRPRNPASSIEREERERRRFWANAVMLVASALFVLAALGVLLYLTRR